MYNSIISDENQFNELLPPNRLQVAIATMLIKAGRKWSDSVWTIAEQLGPMPITKQQFENGERLSRNPIFICGVHRSGTTLLKDMLDGHPDLVVLPSEGTFYTNQENKLRAMPQKEWLAYLGKEWVRRLANPINQPPYWLLGRSDENGSPYVDFVRYVMTWWKVIKHKPGTQWPHMAIVLAYASCTNNLSAKYWVDKTPTNERFLNRMWYEMPRTKVIHMLREPVATLTSRREMEPAVSLHSALKFLKASFSIAGQQSNSFKYMVVRYEDLCNEPEVKTQQIADFLDIGNLATLRQPSVAGKAAQANSSFSKDAEPGRILKPNEHKQHANLTRDEQRLIAAVVGEEAKNYGYELGEILGFSKLGLRLKYLIGSYL